MRRILYIHHAGGIGGAPLSLLYLLQQLDRTRFEPVVVTLKDGPVVEMYRAEGIETRTLPTATDFSHTTLEWYGGRDLWRLPGKLLGVPVSVRALRKLVRKLEPDLVHLNSSTLASGAIACKLEDVPLVWHIREPLHKGYLGVRKAWIRGVARRTAERIVAISAYDAAQIVPEGGRHVRVIHNFVAFGTFDRTIDGSAIRRELGIQAGAPVITMLGGVAEPKGTLTLVRALPYLVERLPDVRVIAAGPPPRPLDEGGLKGTVKRLLGVDAYQKTVLKTLHSLPERAQKALIFTGIRRDVPAIIAASDCVVFPSMVPHFARPVIEAAAMATAAVASDLGGPQELIRDGETGLLTPPGDAPALASAVEAIVTDADLARRMGEAAYQDARERFDAEKNAAATVALYDEILR